MQPAMIPAAEPAQPPASTPQVRTLLLTDLCESTTLVERLGDALAAALFREHDRLVLELQQRWRGRLIDRSDGLLLLFERPIDGLGFALDYMRGLHELGQARKLRLQARAGLHVGEVLTWKNSEEAVRAGAKSLEVEGLAKPLAARLMTLARPGQILLSAVAEPMSHRAAGELGERGKHLVWKSYGRWRFKGVPNAQEIFEVGEPGLAALRMPKHTAKAWRDIPLWRRPVALAAEVLIMIGIGTGAWFMTRSPPAIAFNERDWVVVGDLRNLTGQPVLDESLEQAFRISLEQSRYVNVLSDLKVRDTLALMKRKPEEPLDRATASEVALRDGARAVILPTVAEVGGRVRVSAEVIDPHTQTTVYAESADGAGAVSALNSIDKVTADLRNKLGEAMRSIEHDSAPLPNVSTDNLDALKAYALGVKKRHAGESGEALNFFQRAAELDPDFALAVLAASRIYMSSGDMPAAHRELDRAAKLRSHLSGREKLLLDAYLAHFGPIEPQLQRWQQMIEMYPDSHEAHFAMAQDSAFYANRYRQAMKHATAAAVPQFSGQAPAQYLQGMLLLAMDRYPEAQRLFKTSREAGFKGAGSSYGYAYAAQRDYAKANELLATRKGVGADTENLEIPFSAMMLAVDQGQWQQAEASADRGLGMAMKAEPLITTPEWRIRKLAVQTLAGREASTEMQQRLLREIAQLRAEAAKTDAVYPNLSETMSFGAGYLGARLDSLPVVEAALAAASAEGIAGYPLLIQMRQVLLAEQERLQGKPKRAVARLKVWAGREDAAFAVHSALMRAARADGDWTLALREAKWMASHRGRAYMEGTAAGLPSVVNVADTTLARLDAAEILAKTDRKKEAETELSAFRAAWPVAQLPESLRRRSAALSGA
ncbi:putative peptide modification system cyclase [Luteimonas gilva]|uniref:Putative peptide modification system cyclase n=2 Tax=Luteimonas gilva TaxID=2572684 RepID=A0A4U5JNF8_9GAMM|nr:putative peptide modification system cyclase [Luteimonas gilva]